MPSLSEILNDPNYVNANEETKAAIFTKYAPQDENYTQANAATQAAIRSRFGVEGQPGIGAQGGFDTALYSGYQGLKSGLAALAGRAGFMDAEKAKQIQEEAEEKGKKAFKPTEGGWATDFTGKFAETLGQSVPYMLAPIAAAGVATVAGAPSLVATGISGLASAIQFAGSNLQRQQEQGIELEDTNLAGAIATAIPQAALETLSFRMIPGVQRLFGKAGKEITEAQAAEIAKQGIVRSTAAYGAQGARTGGIEGMTEVGQQFLERLQAGLTLGDQDAINEFVESFIGGAVLGGTLAIPGTAMRRDQARQMAAQAPVPPETTDTTSEVTPPVPPESEGLAAPSSEAVDTETMLAELEGRQLPIVSDSVEPAPINPTEEVAPTPLPDVVEQVEQPVAEDVVPLDDKGEPIETPKLLAPPEAPEVLDPNIEAQLAAEPFDPDSIILPPKEEPIIAAPKAAKPKASEKILSAHEFIASLGGLDKKEASEINKDAAKSNVRIGNKWLYASKGGLSAAQAAEKLAEAGYMRTEDNNDVYRIISESLVDPVYSLNDADAIAERQFNERALDDAERFQKQQAEAAIEAQDISAEVAAEQAVEASGLEDFRQQMLDAGYTEQDLNVIGFTKASPELQAEVAALEKQVTEAGLDAPGILESLSRTYGDRLITKQEYYAKAKDALAKAIREKALQGGGRDVSQADVQEGAEREEGLTSPSEQELRDQQEDADQAEAAKAKADRDAAAKEKADAERKEIAARSEKAAGEFELGKSAEDDLSGQKDLLAIAKKADIPPELQKPTDFVLKEGRIEEVVLAARALADGKITKAEYDAYVDAYAPISTIPNPEGPLSVDGMKRVLKSNQVDKINPDIKDGTRVGIRMDINALKRARALSEKTGDKVSGSVVSIHEGSDKNTQGNIIGYSAAASIKNARFAIRNEQKAFKVAQGIEDKSPQQTIEGDWVNISPEEAYSRVKSLLKDPAWSQVSLDPLRHSFFYDRSNKQPVVAADEVIQVGRFVLAKNVQYAARDDFLYSLGEVTQNTTDVDAANAERVAQTFGGKVVYQDGGLSLVMINSPGNGDPMYIPAKNATYAINRRGEGVFLDDVPVTAGVFSDAELSSLKKARDDIEAEEAAKFAKDPYVKFTGDVAYSPSITPATRKLFEEWKKLLKLNQNIYLATNQDVLENSDKYTGPLRRIPFAASLGNPGITQNLSDGTRYILVDGTLTEDSLVEILAHEMGHAHQSEVFNNAPPATQIKILDAHKQWLKSVQGKNARDFIDSLRAKETAATTNIADPEMPAKTVQNYHAYWSTFKEWYADQTARWATTDEKPRTFVEKFFAKVAETLRNFFNTAKSKGFLPDQTFATYMNDITAPAFLATQPSLPASVDGQLPLFSVNQFGPKAKWVDPEITWKDTFIRKVADRQNDLKTVQKAITEQVGNLRSNVNAYQIQDLAHGRIQTQTADFLDFEFVPILKEMQEKGITDPELTEYLWARHAEEANKVIADRNKNDPMMQDGGSGMDTATAKQYLADLDPEKKKALESVAKKVDNILALTREMLEANGIISKEEREGWESMFQHYVPLQREQSDYALPSNSYKSVGKFAKSRTGSQTKSVIDILANVGINREVAIVRIEKERVKRAVYGLAVTNPNPEIWKAVSPDAIKNKTVLAQELREMGISPNDVANILSEPTTRYFNKETGQVESRVDQMKRYADFVLPVKINGKDRFIFFNPKNPRAMAMVTALKDMDVKALEGAVASVANVTRFFAAVNTQYNLVFGLFNFARDLQGSMFNLTTTPIADKKAEVAKGAMKALPEIYQALRERNAGETPSSTADGSWYDFIANGGKVGYRDQFAKVKESTTLVDREFEKLNRGNAKKAAYALLNWVSNVNDVLENAVRLSSYRVALDKFKSEAKGKISDAELAAMKANAAEIAKNITVNFNTKGNATGMVGALYAFTNASIRGTARLIETVDPRTSRGRKIMGGLVTLGAVQAVALAMAGFGDDEPSEFIKQKNLVIPLNLLGIEGKKYFLIPMPYGLNVFPNLGRLMFEGSVNISKGRGVKDQVANTIGMIFTAFNPIGGGAGMLPYAPTVLDPVAAIIQNRDAFDRPIYREDRSTKPTPGYLRSRDPSSVANWFAEFINTMTGGTAYTKGLLSPTADHINYLAEQVGGGVYREGSRAVRYVADKVTGEETPDYRVPLVGKLVGDLDSPAAVSQKFYKNVIRMSEHEEEIKGRISSRQSTSQYMRDNPEAALWRRANSLENELSKINRRRRELIAQDAPKEQIKRVEDQRTRMMKRFNDDVKKREAR